MSRSSSELKRISRDILNNRYSVPMAAFLTASLIPTLIEIPFSMTLGDYPGTPQLIISTIADILILLIAQMLDTGVMLVHMNMTRGQTYRIRDVFTPFRNGAERFFLAAVLFDVFLVIAGIPAIAGVLYFYKTGVSGLSGALLAAGSILGLIFTFYVLLTYRMVFFFLLDHPHLSVRDAFRTCRKFMRGRRRKLLYILFSFLGWGSLDQSLYDADAAHFLSRRYRRTGPDSRPRLRSGGKTLHRLYFLISYGKSEVLICHLYIRNYQSYHIRRSLL